MTLSLPIGRRTTKCLVPGASAIYLFNEGTGTVLRDYSGNGNDGTFGAGDAAPTWTATGIALDGGDYVALPDVSGGLDTVTIVFSTATPITKDSAVQRLLGLNNGDGGSDGIALGQVSALLTNEIATIMSKGAGTQRAGWCDAAGSIAIGWHDLTAVWTGAAWKMYLDGTEKTLTLANNWTRWASPTALKLGSTSTSSSAYFTGGIAAVLYYVDTTLTAAQIAQNRAALAGILAPRGITLA